MPQSKKRSVEQDGPTDGITQRVWWLIRASAFDQVDPKDLVVLVARLATPPKKLQNLIRETWRSIRLGSLEELDDKEVAKLSKLAQQPIEGVDALYARCL